MKRCKENWKTLPYTSDHLWRADIHGIPSGPCLKCGLDNQVWSEKLHKKVLTPNPKQIKENDWEKRFSEEFKFHASGPHSKGKDSYYIDGDSIRNFIRNLAKQEYERGARMQAELDAKVIGGEKKC